MATRPMVPKDNIPAFVERAYQCDVVRLAMMDRLSHGAEVTSLAPQRGHLTKDGRLMIAYRAQTFHPKEGAFDFPVFYHNASQSHASAMQAYKEMEKDGRDRENLLNRHFFRTGDNEFVAAYPLDPELRAPMRLLKPGELLQTYNNELRPHGYPHATAVSTTMLGYRPERRLILKVVATSLKSRHEFVLKLYRRQEAERLWQHCRTLTPLVAQQPAVTMPFGYAAPYGALAYPHREGTSLHELLESGLATERHLEHAGQTLRALHTCAPPAQLRTLAVRQFSYVAEWEILNRWRRFLKHGGFKDAGVVAKFVRMLDPDAVEAPAAESLVHRDFYPRQLLLHPWQQTQSLIDIDTLAVGPSAVDIGNFLAHLYHYQSTPDEKIVAYREAFLRGYGDIPAADVALFELTTLVRLYSLALVSPQGVELANHLRRKARKLERVVV